MRSPSPSRRWLLVPALACALAAFLLDGVQPAPKRASPTRRPARIAQPVADAVVAAPPTPARRPPLRHQRAAAAARAGDDPQLFFPEPDADVRPALAGPEDEAPTGARLAPYPFLPLHVVPAARPSASVAVAGPGGRRRLHRRPRKRRSGTSARSGTDADATSSERTRTDTPGEETDLPPVAPPTVMPPATVATGNPTAPQDDGTHTGDEQYPTDGEASLPVHQDVPPAQGSISLWVQPGWERGNEDDATLVQLGDSLRIAKAANQLRLDTAADAGDPSQPGGVGAPIADWNPGEWHHVTATWDGNAAALYLDGRLVGRETSPTPLDVPSDTQLLVGGASQSDRVARGLVGRIDVWNWALAADEVAKFYRDAVGAAAAAVPSTK